MEPGFEPEELRRVITAAFPELAGSAFTLMTLGWDCVAVDVDDRLIFKFPRQEAAEKALISEARLLTVIRPAVTMPVPELTLHPGPPLFSRHGKIGGEHLVTAQYLKLPRASRDRLAADMALFFAELHRLDTRAVEAAGAGAIEAWPEPDEILRRVRPVLPPTLNAYAERTVAAWRRLPPDPHGTTFGFFDGHGWNMAFDHARERLNGIYDFADAGFGPLHQEFAHTSFVARDLTMRIAAQYETLTGLAVDRERIELLCAMLRLSELAWYADDPAIGPVMVGAVADWTGVTAEARHAGNKP